METCATENDGKYDTVNCTQAKLHDIEPAIPGTAGDDLTTSTAVTEDGYTLEAEGNSGYFKIVSTAGTLTFPCEAAGEGGCPTGGGGWGG